MSSRRSPGADLRRLVAERAGRACEYCRIHEDDTFFGCEVDHIISEKHGGATDPDNLAFACFVCNRRKGSDIGSIAPGSGAFTRFFNPRQDRWSDHFALSDDALTIQPRTSIGAVTERILGFNTAERRLEREALRALGRYPLPPV
ncbi:MAG TPA: HNH endonuclease signature motif containing protein [Thermoanaerobaculia bacterium]|nr:HNH endonuclease signature motif containing protein [Thermoanaerobaculia bacterium]